MIISARLLSRYLVDFIGVQAGLRVEDEAESAIVEQTDQRSWTPTSNVKPVALMEMRCFTRQAESKPVHTWLDY